MTTTSSPKLVTAEDLFVLSSNGFYGELVRGELVELMRPGVRHNKIMGFLTHILMSFVLPRSLGTVLPGDTGVVIERDPDTVRGPDVAFYSAQRIGFDENTLGYAEVPPDLVVEIRSPNDSLPDMVSRAQMWLNHGVPLVWILIPESRTVDVYLPDAAAVSLTVSEQLDGGDVLPEFACRVGDLFGD